MSWRGEMEYQGSAQSGGVPGVGGGGGVAKGFCCMVVVIREQ